MHEKTMYIPPFKTNKMLYVGLVSLILAIAVKLVWGIPYPPYVRGSVHFTGIHFGEIFIGFLWIFGIVFSLIGFIYAIKEKKKSL